MPNPETNREAFMKVVNPGTVLVGKVNRQAYCKIEFDGKRLSISGVVGPKANGNAFGSCGQILDEVLAVNHSSRGWSAPLRREFVRTWRRWHLNAMRAGCEHQQALGWKACPGHYGTDAVPCEGGELPTETCPAGASYSSRRCSADKVSQPCTSCGYKYGTRWLFEEVPDEVLTFLRGLPDTTTTPAWV